MISAVFIGRVFDHLIAIARVEVHVDVGHRNTAWIEKPFEQQIVFDWIQIGYLQAVGNGTTCRGTTTRTHPNVLFARISDQVPNNEKIRAEPHVGNDFEFVAQSFDDRWRNGCTPSFSGALHC
ncbi:unannotated protein [freshwater metagenome]|uniref:Unannotated protein n=1 Tax=freshwater metagenome TaxID=449393 RepID=A0A6J6JTV0_9ZZZZ